MGHLYTNMADTGGKLWQCYMTNHQLAWRSKTDSMWTSRKLPDPKPYLFKMDEV